VLDSEVTNLVFDLAALDFISSAGLRVFANSRKRLKERDGQVAFVRMQPQIQEVFEIIKALPGVGIFKSYAEMDEYLAARQGMHKKSK
jgi:anti-anti-sigma factor